MGVSALCFSQICFFFWEKKGLKMRHNASTCLSINDFIYISNTYLKKLFVFPLICAEASPLIKTVSIDNKLQAHTEAQSGWTSCLGSDGGLHHPRSLTAPRYHGEPLQPRSLLFFAPGPPGLGALAIFSVTSLCFAKEHRADKGGGTDPCLPDCGKSAGTGTGAGKTRR